MENKKERAVSRIKSLITNTTTEISVHEQKQFTNELDRVFENSKLNKKQVIFDQVLVDLNKTDELDKFILHKIDEAERNIVDLTAKRSDIRKKINDGIALDQEKNGDINGEIIAWNEIMYICLDLSSQSAKMDYQSRENNKVK